MLQLRAPARLRRGPGWAALLLVGSLAACGPAPPSYRLIGLSEAEALLADPELQLIYAVDASGDAAELPARGLRWSPDGEIPADALIGEAPILLIGHSETLAHSAAASIARRGNRTVYVCIARSAEERSSLYARAREIEEVIRGRDS